MTPRPADDAVFLQALLQGIANIETLGYRRLAELGGPKLTSVATVGGGAANECWGSIRARTLGVPLRTPDSDEAAVGIARLEGRRQRPAALLFCECFKQAVQTELPERLVIP